MENAFGIISGPPVEVSAVFEPRASPYIRERSWHPSQRIESLEDGRLRLQVRLAVSQELIQWLLGFGSDVRVESPAKLVEQLREHHRRALELLA